MTLSVRNERRHPVRGPLRRWFSPCSRKRIAPSAAADHDRESPTNWRPRPSKCATREPHRRVRGICGPRGMYPLLGERSPNARSAICSRRSPCCGSSRSRDRWPFTVRATRPRWPFTPRSRSADHRGRVADCPASHEDPQTPEFPGVLRVGDLPHNLALVFPRTSPSWEDAGRVRLDAELYEKLGAGDRLRVIGNMRDWRPATSSGN